MSWLEPTSEQTGWRRASWRPCHPRPWGSLPGAHVLCACVACASIAVGELAPAASWIVPACCVRRPTRWAISPSDGDVCLYVSSCTRRSRFPPQKKKTTTKKIRRVTGPVRVACLMQKMRIPPRWPTAYCQRGSAEGCSSWFCSCCGHFCCCWL